MFLLEMGEAVTERGPGINRATVHIWKELFPCRLPTENTRQFGKPPGLARTFCRLPQTSNHVVELLKVLLSLGKTEVARLGVCNPGNLPYASAKTTNNRQGMKEDKAYTNIKPILSSAELLSVYIYIYVHV